LHHKDNIDEFYVDSVPVVVSVLVSCWIHQLQDSFSRLTDLFWLHQESFNLAMLASSLISSCWMTFFLKQSTVDRRV